MQSSTNNFRAYLESTGAITALTDALVKILELDERPQDTVGFIRRHLGEPNEVELENGKMTIKLQEVLQHLEKLNDRLMNGECEEVNLTDNEKRQKTLHCVKLMDEDVGSQSLLKKYLTMDVLAELIDLKTSSFQSCLYDCIRSGLLNRFTELAVFASDAECYDTFHSLFHRIICDTHSELPEDFQHPMEDWGDASGLINPENALFKVEKCQINCTRSLSNFPFFPKMTATEFENVLNEIRKAFESDKLQGRFYCFKTLDNGDMRELKTMNLMFGQGDAVLKAAGSGRFWPKGRGVFISEDRQLTAQFNYKDHLRFGCRHDGNDLKTVYERMIECNRMINESLSFSKHEKYGFLNASPRLIGNAIEIAVLLRFKKSEDELDKITNLMTENHLKIANRKEEGNGSTLMEIRNSECLGTTEKETVNHFMSKLSNLSIEQ